MAMIRNAYLKKVETRLADLVDEIESLSKRADIAASEAGEGLRRQVGDLRSRAAAAKRKIGDVRTAGAAGWGKLKSGVDESLDEVRKGIDNALLRIRRTGADKR